MVGWLLISVSLPRLPAALTSVVLTLQPVGAVLLAMLILGESPNAMQLLGAAAILAGLLLATVGRRPAPDYDLAELHRLGDPHGAASTSGAPSMRIV